MARKRADGYRFAFITYTEQNVRLIICPLTCHWQIVNIFDFQSTNKCLHFVASGNTHVILGEAVRVKEKKLKVEEKKRKRKKSKKDQTQSSLIPSESSGLSGLSEVQSSVQASPNSSSSNEIDNRISVASHDHPKTGSNQFQNDTVSMRSEIEKNSKYSNEKEWRKILGRRINKLSVIEKLFELLSDLIP